jgi:hypothetical protein
MPGASLLASGCPVGLEEPQAALVAMKKKRGMLRALMQIAS